MASEYVTVSFSMPPETLELLKQIARWRFGERPRILSLTLDQIIREVYQQEHQEHGEEDKE